MLSIGIRPNGKHGEQSSTRSPAGYEFPGCNEVRERGLDPLYQGEHGFSERLDGDNDGIGCEPNP